MGEKGNNVAKLCNILWDMQARRAGNKGKGITKRRVATGKKGIENRNLSYENSRRQPPPYINGDQSQPELCNFVEFLTFETKIKIACPRYISSVQPIITSKSNNATKLVDKHGWLEFLLKVVFLFLYFQIYLRRKCFRLPFSCPLRILDEQMNECISLPTLFVPSFS